MYDEQRSFWICFPRNRYRKTIPRESRRDNFRSIECRLWTGRTTFAYSLNDVVDASFRFHFKNKIEQLAERQTLDDELKSSLTGCIKRWTAIYWATHVGKDREIHWSVQYRRNRKYMSRTTNRTAMSWDRWEAKKESKMFMKLSLELVFRSPQLNQVEKKGDFMLSAFRAFLPITSTKINSRWACFPHRSKQNMLAATTAQQRVRLICDTSRGWPTVCDQDIQTAVDPDFGSLADLI